MTHQRAASPASSAPPGPPATSALEQPAYAAASAHPTANDRATRERIHRSVNLAARSRHGRYATAARWPVALPGSSWQEARHTAPWATERAEDAEKRGKQAAHDAICRWKSRAERAPRC